MKLAEIIYQKSLELSEDKAIEVIDFIYFLKNRHIGKVLSCLELIKDDIGIIDNAPNDLSTNPAYLNGYGA